MNVYDDMPPLVDANPNPQPNIIPPRAGATFTGHPTPHNVQAGWNYTMPQPYPPFQVQSVPQGQFAGWSHYWQAPAVPQPPSMPSPYIPHASFPQTWGGQQVPIRRANSLSAAYPPHSQPRASQWTWEPLSFHNHARPPIRSFPTHPSMSSHTHTPASAVSMTRSLSSSYVPPDWPGEPPKSWRRDFKFKSRFSSLFRSRYITRPPDESTDSARLYLALVLEYRRYPPVILDLRRDQFTLVFRALDRQVFADDLMQPTTDPPTRFMRLYHSRLPWYIDVVPSGNGSYVTLGDLFTTLCQSLALRIGAGDYHNDELDHDDRQALKLAWDERCRNDAERMDGVKRVDFLRGKYMFQGLTRGKNGMWQLRTGRE